MAALRLLNLLAVASLAIIACSFNAAPANALSLQSAHDSRSQIRSHAMMKKKRAGSDSKRCKPRPSSSAAQAAPTGSKPAGNSDNGSGNSGGNAGNSGGNSSGNSGGNAGGNSGGSSSGSGSSSSSGGSKIGIAWNNPNNDEIRNVKKGNARFFYNWSPFVDAANDVGFETAPMLWGDNQDKIKEWKEKVKPGFAHWALGFNEPNEGTQSNMNPGRAAQLWKENLEPLKNQGYSLVSPACTNGESGKEWMQAFLAACDGCTFDAIGVHYYGTTAQGLIDYVEDMHKTFGRPIWLTEFACQSFGGGAQCDQGQVFDFMGKVLAYANATPYVQAVFAFGMLHDMAGVNPLNQLLGSNGQPTDLGWMYLNA